MFAGKDSHSSSSSFFGQDAGAEPVGAKPRIVSKFFSENGLSLAFIALFLICLAGQVAAGLALQAEDPNGQDQSSSVLAYLAQPTFLKGVLSNWQAALFQLFVLIVLTVFLRQKGASHSRKPEVQPSAKTSPKHLRWFRHSRNWGYANSLSLAFLALFLVSFAGFVTTEYLVYNSKRDRLGEAALNFKAFLMSADLWFATFQTWQAEFFAMGTFLLLSVFLRQEGSAESKPVEAADEETGETNE